MTLLTQTYNVFSGLVPYFIATCCLIGFCVASVMAYSAFTDLLRSWIMANERRKRALDTLSDTYTPQYRTAALEKEVCKISKDIKGLGEALHALQLDEFMDNRIEKLEERCSVLEKSCVKSNNSCSCKAPRKVTDKVTNVVYTEA